MDAAVIAALARWPNVPAAYGWLSLTARGQWRLTDEPIGNAGILAFIARNYSHDDHGAWFFQNGPQRVFVRLEHAPLILRLAPFEMRTHTGLSVQRIERVLIDPSAGVLLVTEHGPAAVHDADLNELLEALLPPSGSAATLADALEQVFADAEGVALSADLAATAAFRGGPAGWRLDVQGWGVPMPAVEVQWVAARNWPSATGYVLDPQPAASEAESCVA